MCSSRAARRASSRRQRVTPARYGTVLAPGKLVLLGEYAVLDGGAALVAAIDRGVRCVVTEGDGITTPGDDRFVRAALAGAPAAAYSFSDARPVQGLATKPGFGGSAAATVAAVVARDGSMADALAVHRAVQGGGSGIDVRASWLGGVRTEAGVGVRAPALIAIWSGRSASTGPRVERYRAWADEGARARFLSRSGGALAAFATEPLAAIREAYANLCEMAAAAGLDYDLPAFRRIAALADAHGGAAKPSGAGGGDVAVGVFPDAEAAAAFGRACEAEGFVAIEVGVATAAGWV